MIDALLPPIAAPLPASHGAPAPSSTEGRDNFSQALDAAQRRPEEASASAPEAPKDAQGRSGVAREPETDAATPGESTDAEQADAEEHAPPPVDLGALLPGWPPSPHIDAAAPNAGPALHCSVADGTAADGSALDAVATGAAPRAATPANDLADGLPAGSPLLPTPDDSPLDPKALAMPDAGRLADLSAAAPRSNEHATPLSLAAAPAGAMSPAASPTPAAPFQAHLAAAVDTPAFAPSLGTTLSLLARDGVQQAQLSLHPSELGPVAVQIAVDGTQARIDFHAAHAATRAALEAALPDLAAALRDTGLTLAGGGVFDQSPKRQAEPAQHGKREAPARDEPLIAHTPHPSRPRGVVDLYA